MVYQYSRSRRVANRSFGSRYRRTFGTSSAIRGLQRARRSWGKRVRRNVRAFRGVRYGPALARNLSLRRRGRRGISFNMNPI